MHIVGKILAWTVLPLVSITAFIMAAHLVDMRGRWMDQFQKIKSAIKTSPSSWKRPVRNATRLGPSWIASRFAGSVLVDVGGNYIARTSTLSINAGSTKGITPNMMLYAFQLDKNNAPSYVGAFNAVQLQPNLTVLKPAFRVRADDVPNWTGGNWRMRAMIPASFASRIAGLESDLVVADETLAKQQNNLEIQSKLLAAARDQRDERIAELLGGGKANPAPSGLLTEITGAEDQRDASLLEVDRLRRNISGTQQHIERLIQENNELVHRLESRLTPKLTALSDISR